MGKCIDRSKWESGKDDDDYNEDFDEPVTKNRKKSQKMFVETLEDDGMFFTKIEDVLPLTFNYSHRQTI